ncbi:hypothetical protein LA080_014148 [Diaporthe eres]|nr:hypothetical protein LA080_014148 [Diaporthe eres]
MCSGGQAERHGKPRPRDTSTSQPFLISNTVPPREGVAELSKQTPRVLSAYANYQDAFERDGEGGHADLMYDLPMNRAVAQTRTPRRPFWPTESGVEWAYQGKMSPAAATQQQPAAGEEGGGTLVQPTHNSCRLAGMLPTLWMPTGSSVLVNFDRTPGPLHPTAIVVEAKCRSFRKGYTTGSRLGSGSPVTCHP